MYMSPCSLLLGPKVVDQSSKKHVGVHVLVQKICRIHYADSLKYLCSLFRWATMEHMSIGHLPFQVTYLFSVSGCLGCGGYVFWTNFFFRYCGISSCCGKLLAASFLSCTYRSGQENTIVYMTSVNQIRWLTIHQILYAVSVLFPSLEYRIYNKFDEILTYNYLFST